MGGGGVPLTTPGSVTGVPRELLRKQSLEAVTNVNPTHPADAKQVLQQAAGEATCVGGAMMTPMLFKPGVVEHGEGGSPDTTPESG